MLRALDMYSGAGGAAIGLKMAGFHVTGIDIVMRKTYAGDEFIQADIHNLPVNISDFDFIWASPPCQKFSPASARWKQEKEYPNLIPLTREILAPHPWTVIENVPQAPLRQDLLLWGPQFGLGPTEDRDGLWRKRAFELSFFAWNPPKPVMDRSGRYTSVAGTMSCTSSYNRRIKNGQRGSLTKAEGMELMGIPKGYQMTNRELVEAVPPAYSFYIGREVISRMKEAEYKSIDLRRWKEIREWAATLTEPPF